MQNLSQLVRIRPEDGSTKSQCFSRYYSVDLCHKMVPLAYYYYFCLYCPVLSYAHFVIGPLAVELVCK
jgi:hypothetical protein